MNPRPSPFQETPMQRRTPLRSSTTLARRTRLERAGALKRSAELRRAAPADPKRSDTGPARAVRELVHARSGGRCEATGCGRRAAHIHHRRPRRLGGSRRADTNRASNLLHLCAEHHAAVESLRTRAYALGMLLRDGADPAAAPVFRRGAWVLLDDDGSATITAPPERSAA
jgi:5-methylcytosine-specific restriction protein A